MTNDSIFKGAQWIEHASQSEAPLFRKSFTACAGEKAEITICGLGFFKLFINGKKVSDDLLSPNATNYSQRHTENFTLPISDEMSYRIYCMKYDITEYLVDGENALAVMLGNGYYNQRCRLNEGVVTFGTPKLCYLIEKESGNILSDESTLSHPGFVTENNLYNGEKHDYTLYPIGYDMPGNLPGGFEASRCIPAPQSDFFLQTSPPDKVIRTLEPKLIGSIDGAELYDAGENTVGYAVFASEKAGTVIKVSYAEEIEGSERDGIHFAPGYQTDEFICDGAEREYIPHFTWHGFRYFKVEGAKPVRVDVVHSDCPVTSSFESDCDALNWLYEAYIRTQLCNMHCSVPSDCPHRERLGYTGDGQLCCEAAMMTLDCKEFYRKWLYDISDSQCKKSGHIQHTAPFMGGGGGPCGWGGAIVEVPIKFYKTYGDRAILEEFFPKMLRFFDYIESRSENGLVWHEEESGWCLGDWCTPDSIKIPETLVNSCLYVKFMQQVLDCAEILGRQSEAAHLKERIEKVKKAIIVAYYSPQQDTFCGDVQGASCLALQIGLGDADVHRAVVEKYSKLGMFDTGIIATEALTGYLFESGESQLAFDLLASDKEISFANMARHGATTIWEYWTGIESRNHPMFGAVTKYLFLYLLGIRQPKDSAGYERVIIAPRFVKGMNRAKGHITTCRGKISVEYEISGSTARIKAYADPRIAATFEFGDIKAQFSGEKSFTVEI